MITRRETILGGLLTIAWGSASSTCGAQTARIKRSVGCVLDDDEAEQFLAISTVQLYSTGNKPVLAGSGDREFDYVLAQTLSRIADVFRSCRDLPISTISISQMHMPPRAGAWREPMARYCLGGAALSKRLPRRSIPKWL
jgi:hypothetical protein